MFARILGTQHFSARLTSWFSDDSVKRLGYEEVDLGVGRRPTIDRGGDHDWADQLYLQHPEVGGWAETAALLSVFENAR